MTANGIELETSFVDAPETKLFRYIGKTVLHPPKDKPWVCVAGGVGFIIGAWGMVHIYVLGGEFGELLTNLTDESNQTNQEGKPVLYYVFAITAFIPMMALSALATQDNFQSILKPKIKDAKEILLQQPKAFIVLKVLAYIFGFFAALSPAYLTYQIYKNYPVYVPIIMAFPAYIGGFMFKVNAELSLINQVYSLYHKNKYKTVARQRRLLLHVIQQQWLQTEKLSTSSAKALAKDVFFSERQELGENDDCFIRDEVKALVPASRGVPEATSNCKKAAVIIMGVLGLVIGLTSGFTYFSVLEEAGRQIEIWLGEDSNSTNALEYTVSCLGVFPWAALGADSTSRVFIKFANSIIHSQGRVGRVAKFSWEKMLIGVSAFLGATAAISITYLAVLATIEMPLGVQIFLIGSTFLGPACVRSCATYDLFTRSVTWVNTKKDDAKDKQRLLSSYGRFFRLVEKLSDPFVKILFDELCSS